MKISIAERLHPFSHAKGTPFLIPCTRWKVSVFPTRLLFSELEAEGNTFHIDFAVQGPLEDFTAELDLDRACLRVWAVTQQGFLRYRLFAKPDGIWIQVEKTPGEHLLCTHSRSSSTFRLAEGEHLLIPLKLELQEKACDQLSLGMHKSQNWDQVKGRLDLKEIFPHWLRIGQMTPPSGANTPFLLLDKCKELIARKENDQLGKAFQTLFCALFEGVCVPRVFDNEYQGIVPNAQKAFSPIAVLGESAALIRSLFIRMEEGVCTLLPCLLPEFHAGRWVNFPLSPSAQIDIEWTKKYLRTVQIRACQAQEIAIQLPPGVSSCRAHRQAGQGKRAVEEKRKVFSGASGKWIFKLAAGEILSLDHFE